MAPFPYLPMAAIVFSMLSEQIICMSVFAYAGFMVEDLGVVDNKDKAGYYAGVLSSSYMMGRLLSSPSWGLVADRRGSRFVIAFALWSSALLSIAFGCSDTFAFAVATRFLIGLLNGIMTASKTLVAEVCGPEHETVGMGLTTSSWSLGAVLGPGVGGMLVNPAKHYPGTFSQHGIFGRNPYLLANLLGASLALLSLPFVLMFIDTEHAGSSNPSRTKPWYSSWCDFAGGSAYDYEYQVSATNAESDVPSGIFGGWRPSWMKPGTIRPIAGKNGSLEEAKLLKNMPKHVKPESLLAQRPIRMLMLINAVFSVTYAGISALFTLWALSSVAQGGLEWSSLHIGQTYFASGMMVLVFEVFAVPYLTPWLGVRTSQRLASIFEVPVYFLIPLISVLNFGGLSDTIASVIFLFAMNVCSDSFYVAMSLAINNATGPDQRGELNGISTTVSAISTMLSPIVCSALFAFTIDGHHAFPFNYSFTFYFLAFSRLVSACMGWSGM